MGTTTAEVMDVTAGSVRMQTVRVLYECGVGTPGIRYIVYDTRENPEADMRGPFVAQREVQCQFTALPGQLFWLPMGWNQGAPDADMAVQLAKNEVKAEAALHGH